jgi:hypothetical protein
LRKKKLVAIVLLAAFATSLSFFLYSAKRFRIDFLDGKIVASDGKGPYEDGMDGVQTYSTKIGFDSDIFDAFAIQTGSRLVWINFSNAH